MGKTEISKPHIPGPRHHAGHGLSICCPQSPEHSLGDKDIATGTLKS